MAERRKGKPSIWVTHLAKALSGADCLWRFWFSSRYWFTKFEEEAGDLQRWNRDHTAMMQARARELEREGYRVSREEAFTLGNNILVKGKVDIVAVKTEPAIVLAVDGKTGRERDSDKEQVLIYLYAIQHGAFDEDRPDIRRIATAGILEGEVEYKRSNERVSLTTSELTPERVARMVDLIKVIGGDEPPAKKPSRDECRFCSIGPTDCPERVMKDRAPAVAVGW
jgi:CRISPR/Cas system-associated exonuclease Cas4 (RecB family)